MNFKTLLLLLLALPVFAQDPLVVDLSWSYNSSEDIAGFQVRYGSSDGGPMMLYPANDLLSPDTRQVNVSVPTTGDYYFVVIAVRDNGVASPYSNFAYKNFVDAEDRPATPTGLIVTCAACSEPPEPDPCPYDPTIPETDPACVEPPPPSGAIYTLAETDFSGSGIDAGNWSVPGQSLDIAFEITPRSINGDDRIISKATGYYEQDHFFMVSFSSGRLRFRLKTNGVTSTIVGTSTIPLNAKVIGRVTYNGQEMRLYVNGVLEASVNKTGDMDVNDTVQVMVGANPGNPFNYAPFDGLISVTVTAP